MESYENLTSKSSAQMEEGGRIRGREEEKIRKEKGEKESRV